MGSDKALAIFRGRTLVENAIELLSDAGVGGVRIAGARSPLGRFAEVVPDTFAEIGPLGGIHAGLAAFAGDLSLFLPVDMPLMPASLLAVLVERAQTTGCPVTAVRVNGRIEPFPVVLSRAVLPGLTREIEAGRTGCMAAWRAVSAELGQEVDAPHVEYLVQAGMARELSGLPAALWFQSTNTPEDLAYVGSFAGDALTMGTLLK